MKTSRIIALIAAIAIGLIIAMQLMHKKPSPTDTSNSADVTETLTSESSIEQPQTALDDAKETTDTLNSITENDIDLNNSNDYKNLNTSDDIEKIENRATLIQENKTPMITLKTNKGDIA